MARDEQLLTMYTKTRFTEPARFLQDFYGEKRREYEKFEKKSVYKK